MNVLEKKYPEKKIIKTFNILKFGSNKPELVGTGGMSSQYYPADYDFLCKVKTKYNRSKSFIFFKNIINEFANQENLFFVEFKIQKDSDNKYKIFNPEEFTEDYFENFTNDIELCKLDGLIYDNNTFKEVSCIYFFSSEPLDKEQYVKTLLEDQKSYYDKGDYYKSLKRLMLASKYKDPQDFQLIIAITQIFNSVVGQLYQLKNEVDACIIYQDKYPEDMQRVRLFMDKLGLKGVMSSQLENLSKEYAKIFNREALKLYKKLKLPINKLPPFNTIKPQYSRKNIEL